MTDDVQPTPEKSSTPAEKVSEALKDRKVRATVGDLLSKKLREADVPITVFGDGEPTELMVHIRAIRREAYDKLVDAHPPTRKQREELQAAYNLDDFGPALLSLCMVDPVLDVAQATELWNSSGWSGGELGDLFLRCQQLCIGGLTIPFSGRG